MHHQKLLKFETNQIVLKLPDCSPDGWKLIPILLEVSLTFFSSLQCPLLVSFVYIGGQR